jgi:hypothetical protein
MRLDHGPGSSLGDTLLVASLKVLTTDQPSAELVTPAAGCEPLYVNQAARTALLAIMPTLDDVNIAPVQRGDQSRGVVIPGPGGPGGAAGGHSHGGVPLGGGPAGSRSGAPAGGRGGAAGGSSTTAPGKGKQTRVILDDDEVSSDEDEPLQKRMRQLSGARPVVLDEAVAADKEATAKAVAAEAAGAIGGSPGPDQAPSAAGAKRAATPSGSTPPAKRPYRGVWKPRFVQLSLPLFSFFVWLHSLITLFAQVLSLRCDHRDGHGYRRCSCRGGSGASSCQRAPDLPLRHLPGAPCRRFHIDGGRSRTFSSRTSRGLPVDVFTLMVVTPGPSAPAPSEVCRRCFLVSGGCSQNFSSSTSWGPAVDCRVKRSR